MTLGEVSADLACEFESLLLVSFEQDERAYIKRSDSRVDAIMLSHIDSLESGIGNRE
jgi:hypothetical protein